MKLTKLLNLLKPKPKPRPIYVGDTIVGYDDGLPNSVKIDRIKLIEGILGLSIDYAYNLNLAAVNFMSPSWASELDTRKIYADKTIVNRYAACTGVSTGGWYVHGRNQRPYWHPSPAENAYFLEIGVARTTSDFALWKTVAGTHTTLAQEAVDLTAESDYVTALSCYGTTIKGIRKTTTDTFPYSWEWKTDMPIPSADVKITVTDTSIANGAFGLVCTNKKYTPSTYWGAVSYWPNAWVALTGGNLRDPVCVSPDPLAYFEMPIEFFDLPEIDEYGNINIARQFYGVKMPEEIVTIEKPIPSRWLEQKVNVLKAKGWTTEEIKAFLPEAFPVERINRLAMTWSALIPTDKSGKPNHGTAIVRIFPSSPEYIYPIEKRIQALKEMRGVRRLTREEAIDLALKMDDKLHIHDLLPCTKHDLGGKCYREYVEWRIGSVGDKPEHADTDIRKRYVKEKKGW